MPIDTKSRHITPAGGNVFADLGLNKADAEALLKDSQKRISEQIASSKPTEHSHPGLNTLGSTGISGKRRSRRLRKKLHVGEFQESGFELEIKLKRPLDPEEETEIVSSFITEIIEPRSLAYAGWIRAGFVAHSRRGSATEDDRIAVHSWLMSHPEIDSVIIGPLVNAWHLAKDDKASE